MHSDSSFMLHALHRRISVQLFTLGVDLSLHDGVYVYFICDIGLKEILIPYDLNYSFWRIPVQIYVTDKNSLHLTSVRWMAYASAATQLPRTAPKEEVGGPLMESNPKHLKHLRRKLTFS